MMNLEIRQIGLYDKDGVRQNANLTIPAETFDATVRRVRISWRERWSRKPD